MHSAMAMLRALRAVKNIENIEEKDTETILKEALKKTYLRGNLMEKSDFNRAC